MQLPENLKQPFIIEVSNFSSIEKHIKLFNYESLFQMEVDRDTSIRSKISGISYRDMLIRLLSKHIKIEYVHLESNMDFIFEESNNQWNCKNAPMLAICSREINGNVAQINIVTELTSNKKPEQFTIVHSKKVFAVDALTTLTLNIRPKAIYTIHFFPID